MSTANYTDGRNAAALLNAKAIVTSALSFLSVSEESERE